MRNFELRFLNHGFLKTLIVNGIMLVCLQAYPQSGLVVDARPIVQLPFSLPESSGLSIAGANKLWSHNDAGNTNQLFCFDTTGATLRTLLIYNAANIDWEDLAVDNQGRIYINDAGNNQNNRKDLKIYRIPNPETIPDDVTDAEVIDFVFEDQYQFPPPAPERNFDIEAIVWKADSLFLFTKNRSNPQSGICKMYCLPAQPGFHVAKIKGSVFLGSNNNEARVTSADIHPQTGELLLLTATKIVSFKNYSGNNFFDGEMEERYFINPPGQIEAIAFVDDTRIFLTDEGSGQGPGWLYEVMWESVNIADQPEQELFSIFPNPFQDYLFINSVLSNEELIIEIIDVNGKLILMETSYANKMDTSQLLPGLYFLRISSKNNYFATKILKL